MLLFNRDGQKIDGIESNITTAAGPAWVTYLDVGWASKKILGATKPFCFFLKSLHCISALCIVHTTPRTLPGVIPNNL